MLAPQLKTAKPEDGGTASEPRQHRQPRMNAGDLRDWRRQFPQLATTEEPVLIGASRPEGTVDVLLGNAPAAGLPFVVLYGVPSGCLPRVGHYFQEVWDFQHKLPLPLKLPADIRPPTYVATRSRDQIGLSLVRPKLGRQLLLGRPEFAPVAEIWPDADVAALVLQILAYPDVIGRGAH